MKTLDWFARQQGSPAFRRSGVEQPNAPGPAGAPPAKAGTTCLPCSAFFAFFAAKSSGRCTAELDNRRKRKVTVAVRPPWIYSSPNRRRFSALTLLTLFTLLPADAFPPAPHHTLFGTVRDEMGNPLTVTGAEVILETPTGTAIKATIVPGLGLGMNYKLAVPLDAGVTSDIYRPTAMRTAAPFKMRVRIGQTVYLPIEMSGEFSKLGQSAQSTRLDLTLGEDGNGNGLPDAWERALIAASGGKVKEVRPGDDADGDGLSNLNEYLAGTYAFDNRDGFSLKVVEIKASAPTLEFMVIRGRTYTVFGSSDLGAWAPIPFRFAGDTAESPDRQTYQATDSRVVQVSVQPNANQPAMRFFKLRVE